MRSPLMVIAQAFRDAVAAAFRDNIFSKSAALSYYTFFAIAPLFLIILAIAGFWFGEEAARRELFGQLSEMVGKDGGEAIQAIVSAARRPKAGIWATVIATGTLLAAATAVFAQLQDTLNLIWQVKPQTSKRIVGIIRRRLLSFAMILVVGFLLLVSLIVSAALAATSQHLSHIISDRAAVLEIFNFGLSLIIIAVLFSLILKVLPDARIGWRPAFAGGFVTAILFNFGKFLFGIYIGHNSIVSVYGAMGSLVVILLWVYYSAQILLFGAYLTRAVTERSKEGESVSAPAPIV